MVISALMNTLSEAIMAKDSDLPTSDRRVRRTQETLRRALIALAEQQELSRISVADLSELAGVSRSTFYDHYSDVHELAEDASTAMIDDLVESVIALSQEPADPLVAFFTLFADHAGLYRRLLGPQGSARVIDHINRRAIAAFHLTLRSDPPGSATGEPCRTDGATSIDAPYDVQATFAACALIGVATHWIQHGCPQTPAALATQTVPLLTAVLGDKPPA